VDFPCPFNRSGDDPKNEYRSASAIKPPVSSQAFARRLKVAGTAYFGAKYNISERGMRGLPDFFPPFYPA